MRWIVGLVLPIALAGCAMSNMEPNANASASEIPPPPPPTTPVHPQLPTGMSIIGTSTYGTILTAPPGPTNDVKPNRPSYRDQYEWYAQETGISVEEARKRMAEQQALLPAFEKLRATLQAKEQGNYVDVRMIHQPDWAYVFYFKRDPDETLRKYSNNPRFRAASGSATEAELRTIADPWVNRFMAANILNGYSIMATTGQVEMMLGVTATEFRTIALAKGWGSLPPQLKLDFPHDLIVPRVDPRVAGFLRGFASSGKATGIQLTAGYSGRVVLDDGCLRLADGKGKKGPLVVFHKETGIGLDEQGYVAIIDRNTGKAKGRVGEIWSWAGPNDAIDFDGSVELKAACGDGPIINVGNPESLARFKARYPGS